MRAHLWAFAVVLARADIFLLRINSCCENTYGGARSATDLCGFACAFLLACSVGSAVILHAMAYWAAESVIRTHRMLVPCVLASSFLCWKLLHA